MNIFGKKTGGLMDEIRCDEKSYLIWKWHPSGLEVNKNNRENGIRWGSPLRVKDGEVAVFVYKQNNNAMDFIEGPYDDILKTNNLPIIADIIGLAYEGGTPFQAEVYFINLARIVQIKFGVPYFNVFDSRYPDFGVPVAVRGTLTFSIQDYKEFIKINRLQNFTLEDLQKQIRDALNMAIKRIVIGLPTRYNIPIFQIESCINDVNTELSDNIIQRMSTQFGINVSSIDISAIEIDKTSIGYLKLKSLTADITEATVKTQTEANLKRIKETNRIELENMEDTLRRQREEDQYARHMGTRTSNFATYQTEAQTQVGIAGANALGKMGENGAGGVDLGSGGSGFNPAAMMAGMAVGGAVGQNIAGTMNGMMSGVNQQNAFTPPPLPQSMYHVAINGQAVGPYPLASLQQLVTNGQLTPNTLVWKPGMVDWQEANTLVELQGLFNSATYNVPPLNK